MSKVTAKQEISNFLQSEELGIRSEFKRATLINAAQDMFTANGHHCPVIVKEVKGIAYLINRELLKKSNPNSPDLNDAAA